jgi:hypothetical protein
MTKELNSAAGGRKLKFYLPKFYKYYLRFLDKVVTARDESHCVEVLLVEVEDGRSNICPYCGCICEPGYRCGHYEGRFGKWDVYEEFVKGRHGVANTKRMELGDTGVVAELEETWGYWKYTYQPSARR